MAALIVLLLNLVASLFKPKSQLEAENAALRQHGRQVHGQERAMGIRDKPIAPGSPWLNGVTERLIGTIRRECVDHVVALGEQHLHRVLKPYANSYYNTSRTHCSLDKDAPISRAVRRVGRIVSHALVGGLHHRYVRI
jgi:transposase InsO family protein